MSAKLGYRPDGTATRVRRAAPATEVRLALAPAALIRPGWTLHVEGLDGCRALLGAV
ncbi:MAG: hypothetical protein ACT4RN_09775 [Pseudonocardia sp.]